ncbi:MAG TPA: methyltransferase domain-containing protein, partial [Marmoricola sp.]|nr:methyltransferase domain-containing protein [Marmoricola sp.]
NTTLGSDLSEFHSGYRAYSVKALAGVPFEANSDGFDFDTQIIVQMMATDQRILEVPIPTYYGDEICYVNGIAYARDVVRAVFTYRASRAGLGLPAWVPPPTEYQVKEQDGSSHNQILEILGAMPPGKVLDVGCADGSFSAQVRALGHHVTGIDIRQHPGTSTNLDEFYNADLDEGLPGIGPEYDVIIAADVIEHVRDPQHLLNQLAQRLNPSGRMIISTPNFGHWYVRARVLSGTFDYDRRGILDETHLRFFTRRSLERILNGSSLEIEQMQYSRTHVPFGEPGSKVVRAINRIDEGLIRARPTLFGYQFVMVLKPRVLRSQTG